MGTKNSSWEGRRWEKTSPRCSSSLAWERTLRLNRTVRHMRIKGSRLCQQGLGWWGHNLLPPPIHIHNSVGKSPSKVSLEALLSEDPDSVQSNHSCQGTFNFKGSNTFSSLVCRFSRTLFLSSSWETGTSRAAHSSQGWGHQAERIHGFISVTFYFTVKLLSHVPIRNTRIVFWPCDDCYSPSYCWYGPMTIVIPLVTVVTHLVSVFFTQLYFSA